MEYEPGGCFSKEGDKMNWLALFQLIMGIEEQVVPLFVHNPKSQKVTGIILVAESALADVIQALTKKPTTP